jgi:RimJ/RimL family protein N-acetyltransferase
LVDHNQGATASANPFHLPTLTTSRLTIRSLVAADLQDCNELFRSIGWTDPARTPEDILSRRRSWLEWTTGNYRELERLHQPPLGERAVIDRASGRFLGLVGYVPAFEPFLRLPSFGGHATAGRTMELGLFWALHPTAQRQGHATEAATALIDHAFDVLAADRILATTQHDNRPSIAVMQRLGMRIDRYDRPHPGLQVVGIRRAPDA